MKTKFLFLLSALGIAGQLLVCANTPKAFAQTPAGQAVGKEGTKTKLPRSSPRKGDADSAGSAQKQTLVTAIPTSHLLVSDHGSNVIYKYELGANARRTVFASVPTPYSILTDRTGNLLVATGEQGNSIVRLDKHTGKSLGTFIEAGSGELSNPCGMAFGPDGNLYVLSPMGVSRFDGITGEFITHLIRMNDGSNGAPSGITFGPDGKLYIGDFQGNQVFRYDSATGISLGSFAQHSEMRHIRNMSFGPDGSLYVCCGFFDDINRVFRFKGTKGEYQDDFVPEGSGGVNTPIDLTFGADGKLYVVSEGSHKILSYHGASGKFLADTGATEGNGAGIFYRAGSVCVSGKITREAGAVPAKAQWFTFTAKGENLPEITLTQMVFPDGTFSLFLPPFRGTLTIKGSNFAPQEIALDTTKGDVTKLTVTLQAEAVKGDSSGESVHFE